MPAAPVVTLAQLSPVQVPRDVIIGRVPSPIRSAPIMMSIIAVAIRNAAAPTVGMETPAATARHLDNVCFMPDVKVRNRGSGVRRDRRGGQTESSDESHSYNAHGGSSTGLLFPCTFRLRRNIPIA